MQFQWSLLLYLLALIPLLVLVYILILRRQNRYALRYPSLIIPKSVQEENRKWRRHVPPLFLLLAVTSMLIATARPFTLLSIDKQEKTVILTIDVSGSMMRTDIKPTRLEAAKIAARDFVAQQNPDVQIGLVAFSDVAFLVQPPTTDRIPVLEAVDRLKIQASTAIGGGILTSLNSIFDKNPSPSPSLLTVESLARKVSPDAQFPAVIVLLTDGQNVMGPSPLEASQEAARHGVRIFTVGVGTKDPGVPAAADELDEHTLGQIADITHAKYYRALDEDALVTIYRNLDFQLVQKLEPTELTSAFAGLALMLVLIASTLSFHWFGGLP